MHRRIKKRDGTIVPFDTKKVQRVIDLGVGDHQEEMYEIWKKEAATYVDDESINALHMRWAETQLKVIEMVEHLCFRDQLDIITSVEEVQTALETALGFHYLPHIAYEFAQVRNDRAKHRINGYNSAKIPDDVVTPWGGIGLPVFKRTYAHTDPLTKKVESYRETVLRVLDGCRTQLKIDFTADQLHRAYKYMMGLKGLVAGRFLWQLGSRTVAREGLMSLQNCAFTTIDEPVKPFLWAFDLLMMGSGVGVSVEKKYVDQLPCIRADAGEIIVERMDTRGESFIVPDSRQGWVSLLQQVLEIFFNIGERPYLDFTKKFTYSTILVRNEGEPIRGFGGTASGPRVLCEGISNIVNIIKARAGQQLRPIDCLDIVNIIGSIVVAGNVRRSAIIVLGDPDDEEFLKAKRWDLPGINIPHWRAMSNLSVVTSDTATLPELFWEGYKGNGEPFGLINLDLSRRVGRLIDGDKYPDPNVQGYNPCAEQSLGKNETCCLAELFLCRMESKAELFDVAEILYIICKHSLRLRCHQPDTEAIVHQNARMGIGITGFLQSTDDQKSWLPELYEHLREFDNKYSEEHGFPRSVKLTTVKPSGTLSSLAGVTHGAHPAIYQYFIRNVRVSASNWLVQAALERGYDVEWAINIDGSRDYNTRVISFPCCYPEHAKLAKDMTAIDQLETVKWLQTYYSDNAVSCTIYYRNEELPQIREWLKNNFTDSVKSCSFLLHHDHGFLQAPYQEITKEMYDVMMAKCVPFVEAEIAANPVLQARMGMEGGLEDGPDLTLECEGGSCPIR